MGIRSKVVSFFLSVQDSVSQISEFIFSTVAKRRVEIPEELFSWVLISPDSDFIESLVNTSSASVLLLSADSRLCLKKSMMPFYKVALIVITLGDNLPVLFFPIIIVGNRTSISRLMGIWTFGHISNLGYGVLCYVVSPKGR